MGVRGGRGGDWGEVGGGGDGGRRVWVGGGGWGGGRGGMQGGMEGPTGFWVAKAAVQHVTRLLHGVLM